MRLFRFGAVHEEKPGVVLRDEGRIDVSAFGEDFDEKFFAREGLRRLELWLNENACRCPTVDPSVRLGPCVSKPSKIVCVGLNYKSHAAETSARVPDEPVVFLKATSSLCGPNDKIVTPRNSRKTDWEVELAVVIEKHANYIRPEEVMNHVAGFCLHNDYSERECQLERGGQWVKGKSFHTFAPLGPFLVTKDEIKNPDDLHLWLKLNGKVMQDANTSDLIFPIPALVSYLSQFMSLLPGDVISTGTPAGVGLGLKPPRFLADGDVVQCGIDGLGIATQHAVAYDRFLSL